MTLKKLFLQNLISNFYIFIVFLFFFDFGDKYEFYQIHFASNK